jgi:hypothetical protein
MEVAISGPVLEIRTIAFLLLIIIIKPSTLSRYYMIYVENKTDFCPSDINLLYFAKAKEVINMINRLRIEIVRTEGIEHVRYRK